MSRRDRAPRHIFSSTGETHDGLLLRMACIWVAASQHALVFVLYDALESSGTSGTKAPSAGATTDESFITIAGTMMIKVV